MTLCFEAGVGEKKPVCICARYLAGSLQSQLDSVSFGVAGGGPGS